MKAAIALVVAVMLAMGSAAVPVGRVAADIAAAIAAQPLGPHASDAAVRAGTPAGVRSPGGLGWYSSNWAGYTVAAGPYRSVSGQWKVPAVSPTRRASYSAQWVGIDGFTNDSLIQAGTQANFVDGAARYSAWWEILPAPAVTIRSLTVRARDAISVTIERVASGRWRITLKDGRSGTFTTVRAYAGPASSAEWIEEAPVIDGQLAPLAAHAPLDFDNAAVDGGTPNLSIGDAGAMLRRGVLVESPSAPDADGNGFVVAGQATQPARPARS